MGPKRNNRGIFIFIINFSASAASQYTRDRTGMSSGDEKRQRAQKAAGILQARAEGGPWFLPCLRSCS